MASLYLAQNERDSIVFIAKCCLVVVVIAAIDCIYQLIMGHSISGRPLFDGYRLTSFLSRPDIGNFMTKLFFPAFGVLLAFTLVLGKPRWKLFTFFAVFIVPVSIFLTGERSMTIMSIAGGLLFMVMMVAIYPKIRAKVYAAAGILIVLVGIAFVSQDRIAGRVDLLVEQLSDFSNTAYGKLFNSGYEIFKAHPVTGVGVRNFRHFCPEVAPEDACSTHPHNFYLEWLAETGVLGVIGFVLLIFFIARYVLRVGKESLPQDRRNRDLSYRRISLVGAWVTLFIVFFPLVITMSFFSNWSAILNWYAVSLAVAGTGLLVKREAEVGV